MRIEALACALALLSAPQAGVPAAVDASAASLGRASFLQAVQDLRAGRMEAAHKELVQALAADPESVEARFYLGECLYHLGRLEEAKAQFDTVAAAEPAMPATHYYLGRLAYDRKELSEAFKELRLADSLDETLPMVHYYLGLVYQSHGQSDAAALEFDKALDLEPRLALAAYDLAWIQFHSFKDEAKARATLKRAELGLADPVLKGKIRELKRQMSRDAP